MCDEIWTQWFQDSFLPETAHLRKMGTPEEKWIVLRVDGFTSHVQPEFIEMAAENLVHVLLSTPHATHLQAPLDVSCNGPMKSAFADAKDLYRKKPGTKYGAEGLLRCLALRLPEKENKNAWDVGFSPQNVRAGFKKAGIIPLNKDAYALKGCDTRGKHDAPAETNFDALVLAVVDPELAEREAALAMLDIGIAHVAKKRRTQRAGTGAAVLTSTDFRDKMQQEAAAKAAEKAAKVARVAERAAGAAAKRAATEARRAARDDGIQKGRQNPAKLRNAAAAGAAQLRTATSVPEQRAARAAALLRWRAKKAARG